MTLWECPSCNYFNQAYHIFCARCAKEKESDEKSTLPHRNPSAGMDLLLETAVGGNGLHDPAKDEKLRKNVKGGSENTCAILDLLQKGVDPNRQPPTDGDEDMSAFLLAIKHRHSDVVQLLLHHKGNPNQICRSAKSATPLTLAVHTGNEKVVQLLLNGKADVNKKGFEGLTPLMTAAQDGHAFIAALLIAEGANVNSRDWGLDVPLPSWSTSPSALTIACTQNLCPGGQKHLKIIRTLLENHTDFDLYDEEIAEGTALHGACHSEQNTSFQVHAADLLLRFGADCSVPDKHGNLALHVAVSKGHANLVKVLLDHSVMRSQIDEVNSDGLTCLMLAVTRSLHGEMMKVVQLLLHHNVDVNKETTDGRSALYMSCTVSSLDMIKLLIQHNAEISPYVTAQSYRYSDEILNYLESAPKHERDSLPLAGSDTSNGMNAGKSESTKMGCGLTDYPTISRSSSSLTRSHCCTTAQELENQIHQLKELQQKEVIDLKRKNQVLRKLLAETREELNQSKRLKTTHEVIT